MTCYMLNFNFIFAALLSTAILIHARASPSGTPTSYICPDKDSAGVALGARNEDTDPMFCSYPHFPGENPNDFFCTYSMITGALVEDHDENFCPESAVLVSTKSKGRNNVHAPLPTRPKNIGRIPDGTADRAYLKLKKHHTIPAPVR